MPRGLQGICDLQRDVQRPNYGLKEAYLHCINVFSTAVASNQSLCVGQPGEALGTLCTDTQLNEYPLYIETLQLVAMLCNVARLTHRVRVAALAGALLARAPLYSTAGCHAAIKYCTGFWQSFTVPRDLQYLDVLPESYADSTHFGVNQILRILAHNPEAWHVAWLHGHIINGQFKAYSTRATYNARTDGLNVHKQTTRQPARNMTRLLPLRQAAAGIKLRSCNTFQRIVRIAPA